MFLTSPLPPASPDFRLTHSHQMKLRVCLTSAGLVGLCVAGLAFWLTQFCRPLLWTLTSPSLWTSPTVNVRQCPSHVMHFSKQQTQVFLDFNAKKSSRFLIARSFLTPKVTVSLSLSSSLHSCLCLEDFTPFNSNFLPSVSVIQF